MNQAKRAAKLHNIRASMEQAAARSYVIGSLDYLRAVQLIEPTIAKLRGARGATVRRVARNWGC